MICEPYSDQSIFNFMGRCLVIVFFVVFDVVKLYCQIKYFDSYFVFMGVSMYGFSEGKGGNDTRKSLQSRLI